MPDSRNDYGPVHRIEAEAFGEPGQRTFRVFTANEIEAASLWMEKQQLAALGRAIEEQLGRLRALRAAQPAPTPDPALAYQGAPTLEFRVGQMALGFDERQGMFLLLVYAIEDEDENRPTFSCQATPDQLRALAEQIEAVVAAGRPICPLCGLPIDPGGHACVRSNGHLNQPVPPLTDEERQ
ncbi:MAG: DUF3090 domain-containing protein [Acidothermus sp.]|nr:DUF3090 domain-containing protein [Acidothermus sp.]